MCVGQVSIVYTILSDFGIHTVFYSNMLGLYAVLAYHWIFILLSSIFCKKFENRYTLWGTCIPKLGSLCINFLFRIIVRMWFGVCGINMIEYFICNSTVKNSSTIPTSYNYQICYYICSCTVQFSAPNNDSIEESNNTSKNFEPSLLGVRKV